MHHVPGPQCLWAGAPATACCFTKHGVLSQPASQPANRSCGRSLVAWCPPRPASSSCRLCCHHCPHPCAPLAITMRRAYLGQLAHLPASLLPQLFPLCFCLIIRPPCLPLNLLFILFLVSFLSAPRFSLCSAPSPPSCFLSTGHKWKTSAPWSLARVPQSWFQGPAIPAKTRVLGSGWCLGG